MQFDQLERREFITLLGGIAAGWPLEARAQPAAKLPTIGLLGTSTPSEYTPFLQRLRELGWIEARNVAIEGRWAHGRSELYNEIAAELVNLKVDVIVTTGAAVTAAKQATSIIPIVFPVAVNPLGTGLVASLGRPGGNVTGLSVQQADTAGKRLELVREAIPGARRLGLMANIAYPAGEIEMREVQRLARILNLDVVRLEIQQPEDIAPAFDTLKGRVDMLYVVIDPVVFVNRVQLNAIALATGLPTIYARREYVETGGLMSYGANFSALYRRAAEIVEKILRGAKPADIPVEQPTKFDLVINLKTAKALGLEMPLTLLARADDVIE